MNNPKRMGRVLGGAAIVSLCACHSATTRLFEVDPTSPTARLDSYQAPAVRIDAVSVPASWDRIEILTPSLSGKFEIRDFDHWSAPLAQLTRQALSDDLERRLPKRESAFLQTAVANPDPAAVAHTWSALIGLLADHIATDAASFSPP